MKARREECKIDFSCATRWYSWRVRLAGPGEMQIYTYGREGQKKGELAKARSGMGDWRMVNGRAYNRHFRTGSLQ